jgi:hypothetical protein
MQLNTSTVFWFITNFFGYMALMAGAMSIACGLYCAAELAEEYSSVAKKVITYSLYVVAVLHVLLMFGGVDFFTIAVSACCNLVYASLLRSFPYVELVSVSSIASCFAICVSHWVWFKFFMNNYAPLFQIAGLFFAIIWAIPLMFFVSLQMADDGLPNRGGGGLGGGGGGSSKGGSNIFRKAVDSVVEVYNKYISKESPGLRKHF